MVAVTLNRTEIKKYLADHLGREPTEKELNDFIEYLKIDVPQWLVDNSKSFVRR